MTGIESGKHSACAAFVRTTVVTVILFPYNIYTGSAITASSVYTFPRGWYLSLRVRCTASHGTSPCRLLTYQNHRACGFMINVVNAITGSSEPYLHRGDFLVRSTAAQGVWSTARLDFSVPPGGVAKLHFGAFDGSIPGLAQESAGTLDLYSLQIRATAFEGESVSVTDLLADSLALTKEVKEIVMTEKKEDIENAKECFICGIDFKEGDKKVRDHCHFTMIVILVLVSCVSSKP